MFISKFAKHNYIAVTFIIFVILPLILSFSTLAAGTVPTFITATMTENPSNCVTLAWETPDPDVKAAVAQVVKKSDAREFNSENLRTYKSTALNIVNGMVLQGHDYVYSRSFVNGDGTKEIAEMIKNDPSNVCAPEAPYL